MVGEPGLTQRGKSEHQPFSQPACRSLKQVIPSFPLCSGQPQGLWEGDRDGGAAAVVLCFQGSHHSNVGEPPCTLRLQPPSSGEGRCQQHRGRSGTPSHPDRAPGASGKRFFQMSWFDLWARVCLKLQLGALGAAEKLFPFDSSAAIRTFILE